MSKTNCFRMEIWMCKLAQYNLENHFCVIVSNFKMNHKHKSIHCCLITSKLNNFKSRVDIELFEPSQICCDTILTIPKSNLLYKLKDITDIFTKLEIEKNLEIQLQLSSNFINTDIGQIETILGEGVSKMINESCLANLRFNICNLALENKFEESIILCNKLIESTNNTEYLWHSYYHRGLMFSKLGKHILSLEDARESLKFTGSLRNGLNNRYSYSLWLISKSLENLNDIDGAIRTYKSLNIFYKKIGKINMRIEMLHNIYRLKNSKPKIQYLINLVEKINYRELETNKDKNELLKQMKEDLLNMQ